MPNNKSHVEQVPNFDWNAMFHHTFLSIYLNNNDPLVGQDKFDYAFKVGKQLLYVLTHEQMVTVDSPNIEKSMLAEIRQQAATDINKRFQQLVSGVELPEVDDVQEIQNIYYIGLTSLTLVHQDTGYQLEHDYGSDFFQEETAVDLENKTKVLQLFSLNSFYQLVQLLQTPNDLLSYFDYHLAHLVNRNDFQGGLELAKQFLNSPDFYQRAVAVQQKLVEIGLLEKVETRLTNIINHDSPQLSQQLKGLTQKLQSHATIFQKLLNGATKRRHEAGEIIPLEEVKILVAESMYTRLNIIEEMMDYENRSREECFNGYICHQHSYNDFGNHYVIVVYGLDQQAQYSKQWLQHNYQDLLSDINAQLQDPAMKEYFILGFDMSNDDGKGNVTVLMDVYHQSGSVLSDSI
ncbi:hypothetical protein [Psychrobacter phenylpyruvicus]|uniref:Uncharacterized protein n=1 Tax=Psychrobacter phenylpyruvicus TaxID=29432 RepID=A0A379LK55_9GAMM|nr:hypothetical protein [Psychrobacter phenylpyruvicus]SUD90999.1 Uncharacterised protein [Psychrobacter phenylpyruvicus]